MTPLHAPGAPAALVRQRAREGVVALFPPVDDYGHTLYGSSVDGADPAPDDIDALRLVPPVFMPMRLERLLDEGREPLVRDVDTMTRIGSFTSTSPVYVSALGSTRTISSRLAEGLSRQAAQAGIPLVLGENIAGVHGYADRGGSGLGFAARAQCYLDALPEDRGGLVVQQSTADADGELWNQVYSDPHLEPLLASGRIAFELKVGQGAKPGLGGMTVVDAEDAARLRAAFDVSAPTADGSSLRTTPPGTFTADILTQQVRSMRNNYPRVSVWVKLPPGRDVGLAATTCWAAGADAVTVDGAEGGTGWAPTLALAHLGLPLAECLRRVGRPQGMLLASGRIWEASRLIKLLALGVTAGGLGRAAVLAVDEDHRSGLLRFLDALRTELQIATSALGKYSVGDLSAEDLWSPSGSRAAAIRGGFA